MAVQTAARLRKRARGSKKRLSSRVDAWPARKRHGQTRDLCMLLRSNVHVKIYQLQVFGVVRIIGLIGISHGDWSLNWTSIRLNIGPPIAPIFQLLLDAAP